MRIKPAALLFAAIAFIAFAAIGFAAPAPNKPVAPPAGAVVTIAPLRAPVPIMAPSNANSGLYVRGVPSGTVVPLSRLPRLPMKTAFNTVTPKNVHTRMHPMAASGAYIDISATTCTGALGYDFPTSCTLTWEAADLSEDGLPAGDTKQDYYVIPTNANETSTSATADGNPYTGTGASTNCNRNPANGYCQHTTTLSTAGTYIFGTYDSTAGEWVDIIYVNAGSVFSIEVFSDPYHSEQTYQFEASNSNDAYIYLQNVPQGDYYVVAINQTGVSPNCAFMAPAPTPSPYTYPSNQLCNLTLSSGLQAAGGDLSVTWPLNSSYVAGDYSIEVYDVTEGVRLGQVQVALTGSSGLVLETYPDDTGANVNPSPPAPVAGATPSTIMDWDGGTDPGPADESVTGIRATVNGAANGSYLWTLSDPIGQVVGQNSETISNNTGSQTFTFDDLPNSSLGYVMPPGRYPAKSWVIQLYNTTTKAVTASQGFQILGYSSETQFDNVGGSGGLVSSMTLTPSGTVNGKAAGLWITNEGNAVFNGAGDNLSSLIFTTGQDYTLSNTTGEGVFVSTSQTSLCNTTCTTTAPDSNGNTWNVTITCSSATLVKEGECNVQATPVTAGVTLPPGYTVEISGLYWFMDTAAECGNACPGSTSELPQHGLHWSCIQSVGNCANNDLASTPAYFDSSTASGSGTAYLRIVGTNDNGTYYPGNNQEPTPATPYPNAQLFESYFTQGAYNFTSPYALAVGTNWDTMYIPIDNTGTQPVYEVAVVLPSIMHDQGEYSWLTGNADWVEATCPSTFKAATSCFRPPRDNTYEVAAGTTSDLYYYQSFPLQSFAFQDMQVFGCTSTFTNCENGTGSWFQFTPATTPAVVSPFEGGTTLDNLSIGAYSLNAADMTAYFDPSTVGNGSTADLGFVFQNTSTAVDPNPDAVDILVLETDGTGYTFTGTPTVNIPGWTFIGGPFKNNGGGLQQLWFGLCTNQYTTLASTGDYGGPPTSTGGVGYPLTTTYPAAPNPTSCGTSTDAIKEGGSATISGITVTNFNTNGSLTWHVYAHGIDGGGWSTGIPITLNVASASADTWFNEINGATVSTNSEPEIGGSPNYYQYAIENTSKATDITSVAITLPGTDVNGENATDSNGNYWEIPNIDTAGTIWLGSSATNATSTSKPYNCTVSTTASGATGTYNATSAGANGQIYISGCTTFAAGDTLYVDLPGSPSSSADVINPEEESDSYLFPAVVNGTTTAGTAWAGSDEITEMFSLGLDIVVDPANPGPGGSSPIETCGTNTCDFFGSTIDVGNLTAGTQGQFYTFQDVVRTSIYYSGGTSAGNTLDLYVETTGNTASNNGSYNTINTILPAGASGAPSSWPADQLLTRIDTGASSSTVTAIGAAGTTYQVIPSGSGSSGLELATVPETDSSTPYDIIDDYAIAMGVNDSTSAQAVVVTYTVITN